MLYTKNNSERLSEELFQNPTSEYRGAPFWAWNCRLDPDLLMKEIGQMKEMGMGGFHIHCRSGLDTEYMGKEYMQLVSACCERAEHEKMLCWLYDEDRWPSGFAGGKVTKEHQYRARYLVFSPFSIEQQAASGFDSSSRANRSMERRLLACYAVTLHSGYLASYRRLGQDQTVEQGEALWNAYLEVGRESPWFNNQTYVNTLDPKAIRRFIEETHEKYYRMLGRDFGHSIPAIFTDEPQFTHKDCLEFAESKRDVVLPFTDDFDQTYTETYGESILDFLPELIWELPDGRVSQTRYRYHDHISERFASAYADTLGNWCSQHGIMLTGHMMQEPTLQSQTSALGDCMRSYRAFQLPGIDMLCDSREFTTAKQAASAAHQYGRPGVLSELYGVTNWDFDFRNHKLQGDWQAALGVTVRVHHLNWVSMAGEAKRDYPAPIGYQSPWYKEYSLIENHFSRLNTALTRGTPRVRVGVIHPVESYWLHWGPREQTAAVREELDENFINLTGWLLQGLIDFDFISESLLPQLVGSLDGGRFRVGEMSYDVVLVPGCETLRATTLDSLEHFRKNGGTVVFAGKLPVYVDAVQSERPAALAQQCEKVPLDRVSILRAAEGFRDIDVRDETGGRASGLLYQMREDGSGRWLYLCHSQKMKNPDIAAEEQVILSVKGAFSPTLYDTMTGEITPIKAEVCDELTKIVWHFSQHDSLLLRLEPVHGEIAPLSPRKAFAREEYREVILPEPYAVTQSEPNVLLLDMAEYTLDHDRWQPLEELLRIDTGVRRQLGYPLRKGGIAQPYIMPTDETPAHSLGLRFTVESDVTVEGTFLAVERPESMRIIVNGETVDNAPVGFYVDESIRTVRMPTLQAGRNTIEIHRSFTQKTDVEWCYLLGDFNVATAGRFARITGKSGLPVFGDWVHQGLPFYGGNVTYTSSFHCGAGRALLEVSHFRSPLLRAALDGADKGVIAFAPYRLDLGELKEGSHSLSITAYGNRVNTFGAVHNSDATENWFGPDFWHSAGSRWAYEYQLKPSGILTAPRLWLEK